MNNFELYSFFVCLIVYVLLVVVFTLIIYTLYKSNIKLIKHGIEDERIITEYASKTESKSIMEIISNSLSLVLTSLFIFIFVFSIYVQYINPNPASSISIPLVVKSNSMSYKNETNEYLFDNSLDDQIQTFDLILVKKIPSEFELELYDIVVYEVDGELVVHRIVGIDEPNEKHPDHRQFLLQGDAVKSPDYYPVLYSQMRGVYEGNRIPFFGSFITFLQSPAGYLCLILIVIYSFVTPVINHKLEVAENDRRLQIIVDNKNKISKKITIDAKKINKYLEEELLTKHFEVDNKSHRNISRVIMLLLIISLGFSIAKVSASWNYSQGSVYEISQNETVSLNWPIISTKGEKLADMIVNDATNGLNQSNSYLNEQIKSRWSTSNGGKRDTIGSMAVTQGDGLDQDFALTENGVDFLLQFIDEDNNGTIDYYYLFITDVYLGERGEIYWWGSNKTPGNPTTPIGEYIYPIFRFKLTNENGTWVIGPEEVGSAKSAWYEESRSNINATQIPSFNPDTWVVGNLT